MPQQSKLICHGKCHQFLTCQYQNQHQLTCNCECKCSCTCTSKCACKNANIIVIEVDLRCRKPPTSPIEQTKMEAKRKSVGNKRCRCCKVGISCLASYVLTHTAEKELCKTQMFYNNELCDARDTSSFGKQNKAEAKKHKGRSVVSTFPNSSRCVGKCFF